MVLVRAAKRRHSSVTYTQYLIQAIAFIRQQKQIPNFDRIEKYMQRNHGVTSADSEKHIDSAVKDNLIATYTTQAFKGSRTGVEQEGYKIPDEDDLDLEDTHDWYCFQCHNPGEVIVCSSCWRVYHPYCAALDASMTTFTCSVCLAGQTTNTTNKNRLNQMLGYTIMRLKEKTRELHKIGNRQEEMDFSRFVYMPMDLNTVEHKVEEMKYTCLEEFEADTHNVVHNIFLIYGEDHGMSELARIMIKDCKYDLEEMKQCQNCYKLSNSKPKNWFCIPCSPSHELVYAKQKGYSYWPAKVIREVDEKYDVRFFGGYHQRALIPKESTKPISTSIRNFTVKRTAGFTKACQELKQHQDLLAAAAGHEVDMSDDEMDNSVPDNLVVTSTISAAALSKQAPTPEDAHMVTSSEDQVSNSPPKLERQILPAVEVIKEKASFVSIGIQTPKKMRMTKTGNVSSQTDVLESPRAETESKPAVEPHKCDCDKIQKELKKKLEEEHKKDKEKALSNLSDRLKEDFELDKKQAVCRAMDSMPREIDKARKQSEEKCKEQYMEEMKKLAQKHKEGISQTKKKQWCYNCEQEAMYHCCWNTSYCSISCQQEHWHKEHKRVCRRRR